MDYASMMVYVDDVDSANARIELVCDIADLFEAGLIGIAASVPDLPMIDPYTGGAMLGQAWAQEHEIAADEVKRAEGRFRSVAGSRRSQVAWRGARDFPRSLWRARPGLRASLFWAENHCVPRPATRPTQATS